MLNLAFAAAVVGILIDAPQPANRLQALWQQRRSRVAGQVLRRRAPLISVLRPGLNLLAVSGRSLGCLSLRNPGSQV